MSVIRKIYCTFLGVYVFVGITVDNNYIWEGVSLKYSVGVCFSSATNRTGKPLALVKLRKIVKVCAMFAEIL